MRELTMRERRVYDYIAAYVGQHEMPPTLREIGAAVGIRSTSTVQSYLRKLADAGLLDRGDGKKRSITLGARAPRGGVPLLGVVRAGAPALAAEDIEGWLPYAPRGGGEHFALRIRGDSMSGAGIQEGDAVVVRRQPTAENGDIVVALLGDEATVKRLRCENGRVLLVPENPAYEPIDGGGASILGRVVALVREL